MIVSAELISSNYKDKVNDTPASLLYSRSACNNDGTHRPALSSYLRRVCFQSLHFFQGKTSARRAAGHAMFSTDTFRFLQITRSN